MTPSSPLSCLPQSPAPNHELYPSANWFKRKSILTFSLKNFVIQVEPTELCVVSKSAHWGFKGLCWQVENTNCQFSYKKINPNVKQPTFWWIFRIRHIGKLNTAHDLCWWLTESHQLQTPGMPETKLLLIFKSLKSWLVILSRKSICFRRALHTA